MDNDRHTIRSLILFLVLGRLLFSVAIVRADDDSSLAQAEERIRLHRQADTQIQVVDSSGNPLSGVDVQIEQTRHAFLFGSNIFQWGRLPTEELERTYRERFAALLNYATLPFYWPMYERSPGQPRHAETEQVARWCQTQTIITKGHPLAWNYSDPAWLPEDPTTIHRLQMERITDCVTRFQGLIDRWDVVNEVTHYDREDLAQRSAPKMTAMWKQTGQIEFTRDCFRRARDGNPQATLLINDYRTDPAYERVIEQLVDEDGHPLYDVIGIQSHMHGGTWPNEKIWEVCERFARFGVPLHFTETTIVSGELAGQRSSDQEWITTPEGEAYQSEEVVRFYTMLFSHPAVEAITWWDFSDYHAWQAAPAGFLRDDMSPKPAYEGLMAKIKGEWWTRTSEKTDDDGRIAFRGFLGDYQVTISLPKKPPVQAKFTLTRQSGQPWRVEIPSLNPQDRDE